MSFLTQTLARRATVIPRAATAVSARHFTTSLAAQKTITESAKDGMKTVDRAVSDKLVDGLDAATAAKEKAQQTADKVANSQTASKAQQLKDEASGKASELQGEAKGKAKEAEGKAKGAAEEVKNKL